MKGGSIFKLAFLTYLVGILLLLLFYVAADIQHIADLKWIEIGHWFWRAALWALLPLGIVMLLYLSRSWWMKWLE